MLGLRRELSIGLVGWLWADLLLGLFVLFLAAAGVPPSPTAQAKSEPGIDPKPIEMTIQIDGPTLLTGSSDAIAAEQKRITDAIAAKLGESAAGRKVALVLAFAAHESPGDGDKVAKLATDGLLTGIAKDGVVRPYHELAPGERGRSLALEIYVYQ